MGTFSITDCIGTLGAGAIVAAYAALQLGRWNSKQLRYSMCNAVGSALILISLVFDPNWPSILIEGFWLGISLFGLGRYAHQRWRARTGS
jgi:hypothetical protein